MSKEDLPNRLEKYGGDHVEVYRIALRSDDIEDLPTFPASDEKKDPRHDPWFVSRYGNDCCEPDAMDPNDLRARVKEHIEAEIEPEAWARCEMVQKAEQEFRFAPSSILEGRAA